jgi:hypothetical protein
MPHCFIQHFAMTLHNIPAIILLYVKRFRVRPVVLVSNVYVNTSTVYTIRVKNDNYCFGLIGPSSGQPPDHAISPDVASYLHNVNTHIRPHYNLTSESRNHQETRNWSRARYKIFYNKAFFSTAHPAQGFTLQNFHKFNLSAHCLACHHAKHIYYSE